MTQDWSWILIFAVLIICCGGMMFGMGRMGRKNGAHRGQTPDAGDTNDRTPRETRDARR